MRVVLLFEDRRSQQLVCGNELFSVKSKNVKLEELRCADTTVSALIVIHASELSLNKMNLKMRYTTTA